MRQKTLTSDTNPNPKTTNMKTRLVTISTALAALVQISLAAYAGEPTGPDRGDNPDIGIKYDKKQGLRVTSVSAKILGLTMVDVEEREISGKAALQLQVYATPEEGAALASAWVGSDEATKIAPDMVVEVEGGLIGSVQGVASGKSKPGQLVEVTVAINDPNKTLKAGKFATAQVVLPSDGEVVVIPTDATLKTTEGTFAYVDNAGWTVRTQIELGAEQDGFVEVIDGIYAGDQIVSAPVSTLWMVELQLTKSGKA